MLISDPHARQLMMSLILIGGTTRVNIQPSGVLSLCGSVVIVNVCYAYERPSRQTLDDFFKDTRSQGPHNYTRITQLYDLKITRPKAA